MAPWRRRQPRSRRREPPATPVETSNSRILSVEAEIELDAYFMDLVGIETLEAPAAGVAVENLQDIEIVLVLDVSGSRLQNRRLVNLRTAARNLVTTVLANDTQRRISIAVVRLNGQVNLGPALRAEYNVTDVVTAPANMDRVDLPAPVYGVQTISQTAPMPATRNADTFTGTRTAANVFHAIATDGVPMFGGSNPDNRRCPPSAGNVVRLPERDVTTEERPTTPTRRWRWRAAACR